MSEVIADHILITEGSRVNSPYPERSKEYLFFSDESAEEFFRHAWNAIREFYEDRYGPLDTEYVKKNYRPKEYCTARGVMGDIPCPRHLAVFEVPIGGASNHAYIYDVAETTDGYKIYMHVGASGWLVYIDKDKAAIERPSGRRFVYRNYGPVSSYAFILAEFADALKRWKKQVDAARSGEPKKMLDAGYGEIRVYEGESGLDYVDEDINWDNLYEAWDELEKYAEKWMERWREKNEKRKQAV